MGIHSWRPLEQAKSLSSRKLKNAYCDQGYSGHRVGDKIDVKLCGGLLKRATRSTRKWMKRRTAIEPVLGHLKSDNRLNRNYLKAEYGNEADVVLAAAGYNLAKLLAWFYCAWIRLAGNRMIIPDNGRRIRSERFKEPDPRPDNSGIAR